MRRFAESRSKGMTVTELMVALAVSTIVLLIVTLVTTQSLKITKATKASMTLDEEITKLHTSMNYLVSREFTFLYGISDPLFSDASLTLINNIPSSDGSGVRYATSTIFYEPENARIVHEFYGKDLSIKRSTLVENVSAFKLDLIPNTSYLSYDATFSYYDSTAATRPILIRKTKGSVRFY
ncbi:PilW family protein [Mesotoga sp. UBA5557]|uniref:PilW family protein n=1 Tax=Mesotoga sp. UBA5557 TaxID=1946857 RepID=UPI0025F7911F|nr:prepilin-type N-terminal cleavage/methylation domain-containing protein [Mesotoga sp. UBA5557]